ncbi:transcriptional repressor [Sandaracinobacter sp. RS1-74]|uniref:Fur family transcriptional regulator n=1 Tax=Sandaracinobacteroides sayramensis TaxID=2913411 RepID=UPI001EDA9B6A|nr:transcriptional repressor [Sandaracinobacteroides sayramensis]MCG2842342.1 transcriptional repressor [Sandaracinobacteroides sayramensis]
MATSASHAAPGHAPHGHWEPGSSALNDAARAALVARGVQWTDLRAQVFEALARDGRPVSAYDVAERLSAETGRRIAANSVYRILDLFVEHNLAKRVESRNAYVANTHPSCAHDCIFLVCEACGRIDHIDDDNLAKNMRARAELGGFAPRRPVLELLGLCRACNS